MRRADAFYRAFDHQCAQVEKGVDAINACGLALRAQYAFPDAKCPTDSPLAALDAAPTEAVPEAEEGKKLQHKAQ
jgi:hypothetical protein